MTDSPDSLCAVQQSRQRLINILIVRAQNKAEVTRGWHSYLGGDAGCALQTADFWAVLMKSYPDRLQNPWNESNKMTVKAVGMYCLHVPLSTLRAGRIEERTGSAIPMALSYP